MLLHNDKELFREVVISTAEELGLVVPIVEKDYYVTIILKKLSMECPECVFKGGTDLLNEIIEKEVYKEDYFDITTYFQNHPVSYESAIEAVKTIAESGMFK